MVRVADGQARHKNRTTRLKSKEEMLLPQRTRPLHDRLCSIQGSPRETRLSRTSRSIH
ncbi:hypothetical protein RHMOL_Rhmol06G0111700 [Rhododendron molle]|uniref:Uncharacterized protein n=1 Tax=Rhododendron molle TaxID=49168 RepID=A0ACC0ND44_RHOML|nr:hypothetical protein RHMOL_Rhmol06G0111700 [Rhododendron molle]